MSTPLLLPCSLFFSMFPVFFFFNSITLGTCLLFSACVPPVCKIMIPDGHTRCIHWQAKSKKACAWLHVQFTRRRNRRREFNSKFGVRSWVHLSVHLRSVMRSAKSFSREKHLITASILQAPVAFRKEAKSLFSQGSEGKLITSAQAPGRSTGEDRNTRAASLWEAEALMQTLACHPLSRHHTFVFQFNCKQVVTLCTFLFSVVVIQQNLHIKVLLCSWCEKTLRCEKWFAIVTNFFEFLSPLNQKSLYEIFRAGQKVEDSFGPVGGSGHTLK